jgi:RimJ/RimL family protein N-acetyltransferase
VKKNNDCFLKGKRIYLRPYTKEDIGIWYKWFNDEEVTRHMDQRRSVNTHKKQAFYLKKMFTSPSDLQLAMVYKDNDCLIGTVGLHSIDRHNGNADVSIIIGDKSYWYQKLGKEAVLLLIEHAFCGMNLHKLTAGMIEENRASYRLFSSLGFKQEGLLREQVCLKGKYRNILRLGLLRKNFRFRR